MARIGRGPTSSYYPCMCLAELTTRTLNTTVGVSFEIQLRTFWIQASQATPLDRLAQCRTVWLGRDWQQTAAPKTEVTGSSTWWYLASQPTVTHTGRP